MQQLRRPVGARPLGARRLVRPSLRLNTVRVRASAPVSSGGSPGVAEKPAGEEPRSVFLTSDSVDEAACLDAECPAFMDRDGNLVEVMCCDYGFRSGVGRMYQATDGRLPLSMFQLAMINFKRELKGLRQYVRTDEFETIAERNPASTLPGKAVYWLGQQVVKGFGGLDSVLEKAGVLEVFKPAGRAPEEFRFKDRDYELMEAECKEIRAKLKQLQLSNDAVWAREHKREATGGKVETPLFVKGVYLSLCVFLDVMFEGRPIQRFWFLETVARMPYYSYITMLHLYETLGWWRAGAELRKVHFAEEWNELHHLQIMETLGGDQYWVDRFFAQHAAVMYYLILIILFTFSPKLAYNFSELIEAHAVDTYGEFADANEELLKSLPPPLAAATYYRGDDLYMFDEFQTSNPDQTRRPECRNLHDVFCNIRDDEGEHVKTMAACQDSTVMEEIMERKLRGRSV